MIARTQCAFSTRLKNSLTPEFTTGCIDTKRSNCIKRNSPVGIARAPRRQGRAPVARHRPPPGAGGGRVSPRCCKVPTAHRLRLRRDAGGKGVKCSPVVENVSLARTCLAMLEVLMQIQWYFYGSGGCPITHTCECAARGMVGRVSAYVQ